MPWKAGRLETWGNFIRRFWGVYVRRSQRRLKALEDEYGKLKKLLAESMLDVATLREALGENF
jgi:putative transposase